jgi:hypothetical protein
MTAPCCDTDTRHPPGVHLIKWFHVNLIFKTAISNSAQRLQQIFSNPSFQRLLEPARRTLTKRGHAWYAAKQSPSNAYISTRHIESQTKTQFVDPRANKTKARRNARKRLNPPPPLGGRSVPDRNRELTDSKASAASAHSAGPVPK